MKELELKTLKDYLTAINVMLDDKEAEIARAETEYYQLLKTRRDINERIYWTLNKMPKVDARKHNLSVG